MKIVINKDYGGFGYGVVEEYEEFVDKYEYDRTNPALVEFVENNPSKCGDLIVDEIPDNITDYLVEGYDGLEIVYYVSDGKIYTI